MHTHTFVLVIGILMTLSGCQTDMPKAIEPTLTQESTQAHVVRKVRPGGIVYSQSNLYVYDAILVEEAIKVNGKGPLDPRLVLKQGDLLSMSFQRKAAYYYATEHRTQKLSDALVQSITTSGPSVQGIKQLKNSNTYQGFVISSSKGGGITEHTYTLPGNAKWRLTKGIPKNKKGTSVSIKYLGIKDGQLMFEYIDFQNKPKVFQKSEKIQKEVIHKPARNGPTQVGSVRLDIISITGTTLTYRIFAKL
jgi:hypothetical protein